jgi:hypothetical protein
MNARNIQSGFWVTGIFPFNRDIFTDADFAPGYVLNRPEPEPFKSNASIVSSAPESKPSSSTSHANLQLTVSPVNIRPLPKAGNRKGNRNNIHKRETAILTDSPVKRKLEEEYERRQSKKSTAGNKKKTEKKRSNLRVRK